jgi:tRNA-binding EMAP/Myf-like protein
LKLSYHWLNDYINLYSIPFEKVTEKINLSICEIDHIEDYNPILEKIICVKVISKEIISDNKLGKYIVTDDINTFQIISADLNIEVNDKVPLALPGTKINDKIIGITEIKNNKSNGMFCSQKTLGIIPETQVGVYILDNTLRIGKDFYGT